MSTPRSPLVLGAGPAGLTAALELAEHGVTAHVFDGADHVGGLAATPTTDGWRADLGGHRFFTKYPEVLRLWEALLPADQWTTVTRESAMLVRGEYVPYPLLGHRLLTQLGWAEGVRGAASLLWSRLRHPRGLGPDATFEDWGARQFGRHWYGLFFDNYVRKTWQIDPSTVASDWAHQRIRPIQWRNSGDPSSNLDVFRYPRLGPGQLWEAVARTVAESGAAVSTRSKAVRVRREGNGWVVEFDGGDTAAGDAVFSSIPLPHLISILEPAPPEKVLAAAAMLRHRSFITVAVALRTPDDMPLTWFYTPGHDFRCGRVRNYRRWSPELSAPGHDGTYLGLEYYTRTDDELWRMSSADLRDVVERDLRLLGLGAHPIDHFAVHREEFAYPVNDTERESSVGLIRDFLRENHPTLLPIGRNGMHRYDNQDHAMLSAIRSVEHYLGKPTDPWLVNTGTEYHEAGLRKA